MGRVVPVFVAEQVNSFLSVYQEKLVHTDHRKKRRDGVQHETVRHI